ncbi:MAG: phosphotransferase [Pseudomonadaceae bacterium]|nr:phosphotransferase [Pseudomonadaceae bacterium]
MPDTTQLSSEVLPTVEGLLAQSKLPPTQPLNAKDATVERCSGGYSHDNFHIICNLGEFALRIRRAKPPSPWTELEFLTHWAVGLAPRLIAWDTASGNLLSQWCSWPSQHKNAPTLDSCLQLLSTIATLPVPPGQCRPYPLRTQIRVWLEHARDEPALKLLVQTPDLPGPLVPCHNDLNGDNLLHADSQWLVLDWEWGGLNSRLFDAATLAADLPPGCATLEQLTPGATAQERALAWRWFCLREYAYAVSALVNPNPATHIALIAQRDRYRRDPALSALSALSWT